MTGLEIAIRLWELHACDHVCLDCSEKGRCEDRKLREMLRRRGMKLEQEIVAHVPYYKVVKGVGSDE